MARPAADREVRSETHRAAQAALASLVGSAVRDAWAKLVDPHNLKSSSVNLTTAVEAVVNHYGRAQAAAALTHYRNERRAAGIAGPIPRLPMPQAPSTARIASIVERSLSPLYGQPAPGVEEKAQAALASEVEELALEHSRRAVIGAAGVDPAAKGWARVVEPNACSFCALLATRGAAYKTQAAANFRAHTKKPNGSGGTCRCHAEPVFNNYEPTAEVRQWQADYKRIADEYGHSGRDVLIAWRQHIEGREVTGPLVKPYTRG